MFFCLPDLYIKYITAFFNFLQLCVPQKTKNASFCRFVSSRLVFVSSGPLAALVSLFYYIPNSDLRFFLQRGYEFLLSSEPQIGFNMKKRRNPSTNFVGLCVCVCTEFSFFLVAAAFMIIEPSHTLTHTHTLSPSVQHLSLSQNSRCISESHLKFCFFFFYAFFFFCFFSFLREPIMRFVFRISNIFHSSLWFRLGGTIEERRARQRAAERGRGKTNLLFFHCN